MKAWIVRVAAFLAVSTLGLGSLSAEQYTQRISGKEVVVHTNPVPVVVHRVLPPYLGKHVSARQLQQGRLPPGFKR
jgi:hypothetical protein